MNKSNGIIIILAILAVLGFGLFFLNQMRLAEKEVIMQEQLPEFDRQQMLLLTAQQEMQADRQAAEERARQAEARANAAQQELARVMRELELARAALAAPVTPGQ